MSAMGSRFGYQAADMPVSALKPPPPSVCAPSAPEEAETLEDRTREALTGFDREEKGYAFNDGGEGTAYAEEFAGLLREWLERSPQ